jgi:hypothetical protein
MSEANEQVVRRFFREAVGWDRVELLEDMFASRVQTHPRGSALTLDWLKTAGRAYRDRIVTLEGVYWDSDLVCCRWSARLAQANAAAGASQATMEFSGVSMFRFEESRIVETWDFPDDQSTPLETMSHRRLMDAVAV